MVLRMRRTRYVAWLVLISGIYMILGIALILQPSRYSNTPSYANLISIMPAWMWGVLYLAAGISLLTALTHRTVHWWYIASHSYTIALTATWWVAFVIRYLTDEGTTIVNVVSWFLLIALLVQSATNDEIELVEIKK